MVYNEYGKTGKMVSAVGFGGMRFDVNRSNSENAEIVKYAYEKGINYFDTAPGYCQDKSEDIMGLAFKDMKGTFYVSTKSRPAESDGREKAVEQVKKSLERLNVPKIHFYHIWCVRKMEHYETAMKKGGMYEGLVECREQGLIDHIVFSSHQPGSEIKYILEQDMVEGVLLGINILNFPYRWDGAAWASAMNYGVVAMNPLGGGMIPNHEKQLAFLSSGDETPTEAALRFVISCPQITVALNGFTTQEHIDMAVKTAQKAKPFSTRDIERIKQKISDNMNDACTACGYCRVCPQGIPVPAYMQEYNEKQVFGADDEKMKKRVNWSREWGVLAHSDVRAEDCIECGRCEEECTQHLPIIERLKEFSKWEA